MQIKGERLVLEANGVDGLATVALRPSGIFGEGDPLFVPVLVDKAKVGKLKYIIGNGSNLMDFTYVGNVAHAHILVRPGKPVSLHLTSCLCITRLSSFIRRFVCLLMPFALQTRLQRRCLSSRLWLGKPTL